MEGKQAQAEDVAFLLLRAGESEQNSLAYSYDHALAPHARLTLDTT